MISEPRLIKAVDDFKQGDVAAFEKLKDWFTALSNSEKLRVWDSIFFEYPERKFEYEWFRHKNPWYGIKMEEHHHAAHKAFARIVLKNVFQVEDKYLSQDLKDLI